jgi:hypothetical protein
MEGDARRGAQEHDGDDPKAKGDTHAFATFRDQRLGVSSLL